MPDRPLSKEELELAAEAARRGRILGEEEMKDVWKRVPVENPEPPQALPASEGTAQPGAQPDVLPTATNADIKAEAARVGLLPWQSVMPSAPIPSPSGVGPGGIENLINAPSAANIPAQGTQPGPPVIPDAPVPQPPPTTTAPSGVVQGTGGAAPPQPTATPLKEPVAIPTTVETRRLFLEIAPGFYRQTTQKYQRPVSGCQIIGLLSSPAPRFIHYTNMTQTVFDYTSRTGQARILLTNSTGAPVTLHGLSIVAHAVSRVSEHLHDYFIDWEMIAQDGERTFELGNRMIADRDLVDKLADWHWKWNRAKLHVYVVSMVGFQSFFEPGEWYTLDVSDTAGSEDINSLVECYSMRCSLDARGRMATSVAFREVLENWVKNSNETARFVSRPTVWGWTATMIRRIMSWFG